MLGYGSWPLLLPLALAAQGALQPKNKEISYDTAVQLASLPLHCIGEEYPNKLSQLLKSESDLLAPSKLHPVFYGCYDWHSAVHGHWLLAKVGNLFPETELMQNVSHLFTNQFTSDHVAPEEAYFQGDRTFERTYGWAWLLKLQEELLKSPHQEFNTWAVTLQPLVDNIVDLYKEFLPKLVYPVRVGEHPNTAFGLSFALDYARHVADQKFVELIASNASGFFSPDKACPLTYEPSGTDFLSPCLAEADLMARIISEDAGYEVWLRAFLPQVFDKDFNLQPGQVVDRTDGKLVHLDGLNFSRAWSLFNIAARMKDETMKQRLIEMGDLHLETSMGYVVGSDYVGSHWLASFLLHALEQRQAATQTTAKDKIRRI